MTDTAPSFATGSMPCDARWADEQVDLLRRWIDSGTAA